MQMFIKSHGNPPYQKCYSSVTYLSATIYKPQEPKGCLWVTRLSLAEASPSGDEPLKSSGPHSGVTFPH